jgi:hypothetical protein
LLIWLTLPTEANPIDGLLVTSDVTDCVVVTCLNGDDETGLLLIVSVLFTCELGISVLFFVDVSSLTFSALCRFFNSN